MQRNRSVSEIIRYRHVIITGWFIAAFAAHASTAQSAPTRQWGTYYGGTAADHAADVCLNSAARPVVVGYTKSSSGIASAGAHDTVLAVNFVGDAFVGQFDYAGARIWGTYYGGAQSDHFEGVATDSLDNIYAVGVTDSTTDIASPGAHDTTLGSIGDTDIMLVKFNDSGVRQWGTYLGGDQHDDGYGVCVEPVVVAGRESVYVVGWVRSPTGIATVGAHDTTLNGYDAVLAKFSASGRLQWATYYGGAGEEFGLKCVVDSQQNVYLAGRTKSATDIASGGHDNSFGGGTNWDGFLVKFDGSGNRLWGTYYGGTGHDEIRGVDVDASDNVYVAGYTQSSMGSLATIGAYDTSLTDSMDGFVAKFNPLGVRQWGTYFGDSNSYASASEESFTDLEVVGANVYLSGYTDSTTGIATAGAFDATQVASEAMFVVMSTSVGVPSYATYNGGTGNDLGYGVAASAWGKAAMVGGTNSVSSISTAGTHDTTHNGVEDAFITYIDL